jgi:hypothetical protein
VKLNYISLAVSQARTLSRSNRSLDNEKVITSPSYTIKIAKLLLAIGMVVLTGCSGNIKKTEDGYNFDADIKDGQGLEIKSSNPTQSPIPETTTTPEIEPTIEPTEIPEVKPQDNDVNEHDPEVTDFAKEKETLVNNYTQALLNKDYELAYSMLSDRFKGNRAGKFDTYEKFWEKTTLEVVSVPRFITGSNVLQIWKINGTQRNLIFFLTGANGDYKIDQVN